MNNASRVRQEEQRKLDEYERSRATRIQDTQMQGMERKMARLQDLSHRLTVSGLTTICGGIQMHTNKQAAIMTMMFLSVKKTPATQEPIHCRPGQYLDRITNQPAAKVERLKDKFFKVWISPAPPKFISDVMFKVMPLPGALSIRRVYGTTDPFQSGVFTRKVDAMYRVSNAEERNPTSLSVASCGLARKNTRAVPTEDKNFCLTVDYSMHNPYMHNLPVTLPTEDDTLNHARAEEIDNAPLSQLALEAAKLHIFDQTDLIMGLKALAPQFSAEAIQPTDADEVGSGVPAPRFMTLHHTGT
ncbi:hypothetical protein SARC_00300 [Sphaeroforma arctica JP610]|uniref:Uncharacterized protein n=1 Tax=Sphaeroforma arctica JP610 TaxID=667725 RepID=A0A0L0GF00_9EUKA|nr:hypothetical protein SARC_00300 [Sphaeroforma arctica JP610]KNC87600.1 hypothetical protein SARC_00300 [Sphaeroforma arctica JP610]|eukprot:XP_014161502.1 hypothetical protein SARC_00300 [Sphaeroforma arctica JP610]